MKTPILWRLLMAAAGGLLLLSGPHHPQDRTMADMLVNPDWIWVHTTMLVAFMVLTAGLTLQRHAGVTTPRTSHWLRLAVIGTILQAVEMAVHTLAYVDHGHLVAGQQTPVLTTHLWLSVVLYPAFAISMIGLIIAGMRDRTIGSVWIGWIGILGVVGHGLAPVLVVAAGIIEARVLFPLLAAFALWLVLAAVWPARPAPSVS